MRLASVRDLIGLQPVLMDPTAKGPDPVYMVVTGISQDKWVNLTIISPGRYGQEFPKTFGHYHGQPIPETYHVVSGEGLFLLQKKQFDDGVWEPGKVGETLIISAKPGDEIIVPLEYGHSWTNTGNEPLLLYDNWSAGHESSDYAMIEKFRGMAYYLIDEGGKPKAVKNSNYQNLPEPLWLTAGEFAARTT